MMKPSDIIGWMTSLFIGSTLMAAVTVSSPDGTLSVSFEVKDDRLVYSVSQGDNPVTERAEVGIIKHAKMAILDQSVRQNDTLWKPVWGQFSTIRDHHNELTLSLTADGMPVTLLCRIFDTGLGLRFLLTDASQGKHLTFSTVCGFAREQGYYHPIAEQGVDGPLRRSQLKRVQVPLVLERNDGRALAMLESDLYSAAPFEAMKINLDPESGLLVFSSEAVSQGHDQVTPWHVMLVERTLGDLTVNTVALNLAAPCRVKDASWIKPGKSLWDWRVHGYSNGDFAYGIDTRSYLRFIDFCAEYGIEYFLIDDHWFTKANEGELLVSPEVDIKKVMDYAKEKGVRIVLYYDRKKGNFGDKVLFRHYAGLGAAGIKYGFMGNRADFTRGALEAAINEKVLIDFHDGPVPMTGVERTLPNAITREYCHSQQDARRAFTPETFLRMTMVNALVGPLDMCNGNFGIKGINAGQRQKGPRQKNTYISTVVSEVARCLMTYTGLVVLPDAPEEYRKKADLFDFLKHMPATWDDTRLLHAKMAQYYSIARRSGERWFIGAVNDRSERTLDLRLDFLEPGKTYEAKLYQDAPDADGVKNPEAYTITTIQVKQGDVVKATMASGGGYAAILECVK